MDLSRLEQLVWYLNIAAAVVLAIVLCYRGLANLYGLLLLYLGVDTVEQILRLLFHRDLNWDARIYFAGQTVKVIIAVLIVLNLYRRAMSARPGLERLGRRTIGRFFMAAAIVSALGIFLDIGTVNGQFPILHAFLVFERTMDSLVLAVLVFVVALLLWFPIKVPNNLAVYIGGFVLYWFARWAGLLAQNLWPRYSSGLSTGMLTASLLCLAGWSVLFCAKGEIATTITGHRWNAAEAERLTRQLDAINARLEDLNRYNTR